MARRKVQLAYIVNASKRKASYKKRKKGLVKKVSELSTLCDVEACAIIYNPYNQTEPEVWPSRLGAQATLNRLNSLPKVDQTRKMFNQESYTRMRIKKAEDQLARLRRENKKMMLENFLYQYATGVANFDSFDPRDTTEMQLVISDVLQDLNSRMEAMRKAGEVPPLQPDADSPPPTPQLEASPSNLALAVPTQVPPTYDATLSLTTMSQAAPLYLPGPSVITMSQAGPRYNLPGPSFAADMSQPMPSFEVGFSFASSSQALITPQPVEMEVSPWVSEYHNLLDSFPFSLLQRPLGNGFELDDGLPYWAAASAEKTAMALDPAPFDINNNFSETLPTYVGGSGSMDPGLLILDDQHMLPPHGDFNFANTQQLSPPPPARSAAAVTTTIDATVTPQSSTKQ